jgi:hypothetical protein
VVLVQSVSKLYRLYQNPSDRIRELIPFQSRTERAPPPIATRELAGVVNLRAKVEWQKKPARERALP